MPTKLRLVLPLACSSLFVVIAACGDSTSNDAPNDSGVDVLAPSDAGARPDVSAATDGPADVATEQRDASDAGKVIAPGMLDPVAYLSRDDSPFKGVVFASYSHFEDWEDGVLNTPGVTADSTSVGSDFGAAFVDSIDGDDGIVDGKCEKAGSSCNSAFGNGSISFSFDATALGALPTHVGIAWTDGSPGCDAIFEAYDSADVLIGSKTAAGVGDGNNNGGPAEDRFFGVVHPAGVKKIIVKSSSGGVEADHLTYGR